MYCGLDFRDPNGLLHLSLLLVVCCYHLVRSFDESWGGEIDVRAIELRPFLPVTDFTAINASNGGIAIFFNVTGFKTLTTGGGRGRREGCIKVNLSDPRDDVGKFKRGYVGDQEVIISFFVESIESIASLPTMISSVTVTSLVIIASDFDGLLAGTQGFVDCGVIGREAIVVGGWCPQLVLGLLL